MQFAGLKVSPKVVAGLFVFLVTLSSTLRAGSSAAEVSWESLSVTHEAPSRPQRPLESSSVIIVIGHPGGGDGPVLDLSGFHVRKEFTGPAEDGALPVSLIRARDGTLYGSTIAGGANDAGTLFKVVNSLGGAYLPAYSFDGSTGGRGPAGSLVEGADGNIYGVTSGGGAYDRGTVFRMSLSGNVTVLHSFGAGIAEGVDSIVYPMTLMQASDGNFYGVAADTFKPGFAEWRTIYRRALFKMTPEGDVTVLGGFNVPAMIEVVTNNGYVPDIAPVNRFPKPPDTARMVESNDGSIYFASDSKLYRYEREKNLLTQIELPAGLIEPGNLLRATNGNIYGTAQVQSGSDFVLIKIAAADGTISQLPGTLKGLPKPLVIPQLVLYTAGGPTSLTEGSNGMLYGAWTGGMFYDAKNGGVGGYLFSINPETDQTPQILDPFPQSLAGVQRSLLVDSTGSFWGLTNNNSSGALYSYRPSGAPNHPPVAQDDQFVTSISGNGASGFPTRRTLTANLLANDSDPDQDSLSIVDARIAPAGNTVAITELKADGTITLTQTLPLTGSVQVNYTVMDARGATASAKAVFSYSAPAAQDDAFRIRPVPRETLIDVGQNDSVADGGALLITACTRARHGRVRISDDGKSLIYKPGASYRGGDSFEYTISDSVGGTATAKVRIENPFVGLKGDYYGLIGNPETVGSVRLLVSRSGGFSAAVYYGGRVFRLHGQLSMDGQAEVRVPGSSENLSFYVYAAKGQRPTMNIVRKNNTPGGLDQFLFSTSPSRIATKAPAKVVGRYTVVLPADPSQPGANYPQGDGFALLKVGSNGSVKLTGRLGDGVSFSGGTLLLEDGSLPFYLDAYSKKVGHPGGVSGKLRFSETEVSDVSGKLEWIKPRQNSGPYAAGFTGTIAAIGCRWTPLEQLAEEDQLWPEGAVLHMGEGELPDKIRKGVDLGDGEDLVFAPEGVKMKLRLDPDTGFFSGKFTHPETDDSQPIEGVVLQKQQRGAGVFAGTRTMGWVVIEPRE